MGRPGAWSPIGASGNFGPSEVRVTSGGNLERYLSLILKMKNCIFRATGSTLSLLTDLLKEIEVLAVVQQSNNVNSLAMISAKQERDEPVRQFAARLRGLQGWV
jgi:hypothetical protein